MGNAFVLSENKLYSWIDELITNFSVFGPILKKRNQTVFEKVTNAKELHLDYCCTMTGPRKFIYPSRQLLFKISREKGKYETVLPDNTGNSIIFAIHPCDMHAISVLDRTFLGDYRDFYYGALRQNTITVVLNCNKACDKGFCASMGTGPFLQVEKGFDIVLTAKPQNYLIEFGSKRGLELITKAGNLQKAQKKDFKEKSQLEHRAIASFSKCIDTTGLPELLMQNPDHPVYKRTADTRCLGCTNCTMVCPTCYCYSLEDNTTFDLKVTSRERYWDSCQELNFAGVYGGNFRSSREARLRQFVIHKLGTWIEQYGCFGCIGCGRCMSWCPTGIDLTEMAKEIQQDHKGERSYEE